MLKGKQKIMRLETYGKEAYSNKHLKVEQNKQRIRVFWVTTSYMLEQVWVCMSLAYVRRLNHAYADPYLETLINTKIEQKPKKRKI